MAAEQEKGGLHKTIRDACAQREFYRTVRSISSSFAQQFHPPAVSCVIHAPIVRSRFKEDESIDGFIVLKAFRPGGFGEPYLVYPRGGDRLKDRIVLKVLRKGSLKADLEERGLFSVYSMLQRVSSGELGDSKQLPIGQERTSIGETFLLPCLGSGKAAGGIYVLTEYCPGGSLADLLEKNPKGMGIEKSFRFTRDVLRALCILHAHGLSHNDIKPGNIFLHDAGAVLGDYSIVSRQEDIPRFGTPGFISPERLAGKADQRADIYSIGVTLFELVTGLPADFHMDLTLSMDKEAREIIEKSKKYDSTQRYASCGAMLGDLERYGGACGWWPVPGITRKTSRNMEEAFILGMTRNFSQQTLSVEKDTFRATGNLQEGNEIGALHRIAVQKGCMGVLDEMPQNRWVERTFRHGRLGSRIVLVGACINPLEELLCDGATTERLSQNDLCAAAKNIAKSVSSSYIIGLFAPCGWMGECKAAQGPNWKAFPIHKLEGTRWQIDAIGGALIPFREVFDPETRQQKVDRAIQYIKLCPKFSQPDGTITLKEVEKAEGSSKNIVLEAFESLCHEDNSLEITELPGFGPTISRKGLGWTRR